MAKVPDMFEDLRSQYSVNEEFISDNGQVSPSQDSFYTNPSPQSCTKLDISKKTHQLNSQEYVDAAVDERKNRKKRQISVNHPITSNPENNQDVIRFKSASSSSQNNMEYTFHSFLTNQTISDQDSRSVMKTENHLRAIHLQGSTPEELFDIGRYLTLQPAPNNGIAVTIRIANTKLYVTAKGENKPVVLQELPNTPTTLDSHSQHLFYWTTYENYSTFTSLAYPELFLATDIREGELLFLAKGPPALVAFLVVDE